MDLFKERLKELRKTKNISINKLALVLDVDPATISCYESGKRKPNFNHLIELSKYFNVSIDYLCGINIENPSTAERLNQIVNNSPILYNFISSDYRSAIKTLENFAINSKLKKVATAKK